MEITIPSQPVSQVCYGYNEQKYQSWKGEYFVKYKAQANLKSHYDDYHQLAGEKINVHETIRKWNSR